MQTTRISQEDDQLGGHFIPKGVCTVSLSSVSFFRLLILSLFFKTFVEVWPWLLHRSEEVWGKDVLEFKPERFEDGASEHGWKWVHTSFLYPPPLHHSLNQSSSTNTKVHTVWRGTEELHRTKLSTTRVEGDPGIGATQIQDAHGKGTHHDPSHIHHPPPERSGDGTEKTKEKVALEGKPSSAVRVTLKDRASCAHCR